MVNFEYLEDENGEQQVISEIASVAMKGMEEDAFRTLSELIAQGLDFLEYVGIPKDKKHLPFTTTNEDGNPLTFATIIKELKHHPPLLEYRVNWRSAGFFRAIFFYLEDSEGNQTIYFTKALVKQEKNPPEFEILALESEQMLKDFIAKNSK